MRMVSWGKRVVLLGIVCLVCVQFVHLFGAYCPEWLCRENTVTDYLDSNRKPWLDEEKLGKVARSQKAGLGKVGKTVMGRYRDNGISLWHANGTLKKLDAEFSVDSSDVLVFLHIQKTGGTAFGKNMVKNLIDPSSGNRTCFCREGSKRCKCYRPSNKSKEWLFSRFSTGWKCGLHADWTELTSCVDQVLDQAEGVPEKRRYFYMTLLRNPYRRYLSEFLHVQRGATWKNSRHWCGGRFASRNEIHPCFEGDTWEGVTLDEFLQCPDNLAVNRQTRMLADLELVGCYDRNYLNDLKRNDMILASAKSNLLKMAFFGIVEQIDETQFLFEETFGLHFAEKLNGSYFARGENFTLTPEQRELFLERIALDVQLYEFAVKVFRQRLETVKNWTFSVGQ
ncbi:heparan-sulfate 6-O-sulfotransferase 3-B-like [Paramacrobiotus metropolitanus]|uniref:heparan-sulfate 6-O-sulfotransferase 3-B-like n=1 Tax=Paramacrobiotus metropolitanus TaxID=2943436 RepID=UPI002445B603|nr:heparan-sulfate 6-O-sulfotransferase 3-B-like [Paramacrobiotus metropolitanus]